MKQFFVRLFTGKATRAEMYAIAGLLFVMGTGGISYAVTSSGGTTTVATTTDTTVDPTATTLAPTSTTLGTTSTTVDVTATTVVSTPTTVASSPITVASSPTTVASSPTTTATPPTTQAPAPAQSAPAVPTTMPDLVAGGCIYGVPDWQANPCDQQMEQILSTYHMSITSTTACQGAKAGIALKQDPTPGTDLTTLTGTSLNMVWQGDSQQCPVLTGP